MAEAVGKREEMFRGEQTTGYRLIHGESDGWPGMVLDRYDGTRVWKLYSAVWLPRLSEMATLLEDTAGGDRLVVRLSRNIQAVARERFDLEDGAVSRGAPLDGPVTFVENGVHFLADVARGQKTGFFLDQRENRREVGHLAAGRDVLNAFSFSGGFSVYAAKGGARSATDLDLSAHALEGARRHFELNRADPGVAGCRHETVQADAFDWLREREPGRYGLVVLDPPSLARRESERDRAIGAYGKLAACGLRVLMPGGILVAASCSAHVTEMEFFGAVRDAARRSGRRMRELRVTGHPPDHPAGFLEARYLKCIYLQAD
jgi:23S rRNA (cytosine1962-C5)-methyltransferase